MPVNESKKRKPKPKDRTPSVWNPDWKYTPAGETDLAKKFKRIERERKENESKKVRRIR
jgi:hypothetical protein